MSDENEKKLMVATIMKMTDSIVTLSEKHKTLLDLLDKVADALQEHSRRIVELEKRMDVAEKAFLLRLEGTRNVQ